MSHGADRADILHQLDIGSAVGEGVITDHGAHRLTTKLSITAGVDMLVETGLGDFGGKLEIFQQLFLGGVQHLDLDVLAKIGAIHQQLQRAPGGLHLLQRLGMEDDVHLLAELLVELDNHAVHQCLVDRTAGSTAIQNVGDQGCDPLLGDAVTLINRGDARLCHDFVQQRGRGGGIRPRLNLFFDQRHVCSFSFSQYNPPITRLA